MAHNGNGTVCLLLIFVNMLAHIPILMYHGIAGTPDDAPSEWSARHTVTDEAFRAQLALLDLERWRTLLPDDFAAAARVGTRKQIVITFDDGHSSDTRAADALAGHKMKAVFFITWSHLGRSGFLARSEVLTLASRGFAIGSHGLTHTRMSGLDEQALRRELFESRSRLEDLIGMPVLDFACPFGAYNSRVVACAHAAGYRTVMTSDIRRAAIGIDSVLPRLPIRCDTHTDDFKAMLSEGTLMIARRRWRLGLARRRRKLEQILLNGWGGRLKRNGRNEPSAIPGREAGVSRTVQLNLLDRGKVDPG